MRTIDDIFELLEERGQASYFGEPVSQLEHALQCAQLAVSERASQELIAAALLHDLGHLLHEQGEHVADCAINTEHENLAESWLAKSFPASVTQPIALHVAAKRYLCASDPGYLAGLSKASLQSLELQGGAMTAQQAAQFEQMPFAPDAVRLRRWDDLAKKQGAHAAPLSAYRELLEQVLQRASGADLVF